MEDATDTEFPQFDVVSDASDHAFVSRQFSPCSTQNGEGGSVISPLSNFAGSGVCKRIMREWRILEQNLPESIFVRAYETRIDLLRAAIVGAAGTPYHDGLFFFDIAFPPDYPAHPPKVRHRSFGLKLNPHLYGNGHVCLSLINTWTGKKCEKWNPSESTVLQLLVSIQGLVLTEKPVYDEHGSGLFGRAILEKTSRAYDEDVFVMNCKTMVILLRSPHRNFESFVSRHFRERAHAILSACINYVAGHVRVGYYESDGPSKEEDQVGVSKRFKTSMKMIYPLLVAEFRENGTYLGDSVERLELELEKYEKKKKKKMKGILRRIIRRLRML